MATKVPKLDKRVTVQHLVAASPDQFQSGEPDKVWADLLSPPGALVTHASPAIYPHWTFQPERHSPYSKRYTTT